LQEVEKRDYETDIAPWLTCQGYGMSFKKRTGNDPNKPDGVLTAYKLSKFDVIGSLPIEYHRYGNWLRQFKNLMSLRLFLYHKTFLHG